MPETHTHTWGPIQQSRLSGEPSRPCTDFDCKDITLDLYLYCGTCFEPLSDPDVDGVYHHVDPDTRAIVTANHEPVPETGEAPYDEETEG